MIDSHFLLATFIPSFISSSMIVLDSISVSDNPKASADSHSRWPAPTCAGIFGHLSLRVYIQFKLTCGHPEGLSWRCRSRKRFLYMYLPWYFWTPGIALRLGPLSFFFFFFFFFFWLYFFWHHGGYKRSLGLHENRPGLELMISRVDKYYQ